jgi:ABC-type transport system substrate-binding protein
MKHFAWQWLAASSLLLTSIAAGETRPQYGGTLRVAMQESLSTLDPADASNDSIAARNLLALLFEALVTVDDRGIVHPVLATEWQVATGNQRWQFQIRRGVRFHDGSELTPETAAAALRLANPSWKIFAEGNSLIVELDHADPNLVAELALTRNSIVKKNGGGMFGGTGPFQVENWQPGKHLTLAVAEDYWRGRPFLDAIDVEMGRNFHEQELELESGKMDLVEVSPEQAHRVSMQGRRVSASQPVELVALVFASDAQTDNDKLLRAALAQSIERGSMRSVLLQGAGEPAGSVLPNWMTGYTFTFSTEANLKLARQELQQLRTPPNVSVRYDASDPLARTLVDRIALNAKDAGISLQPTTASHADATLMRIPLASTDPWIALANLAAAMGTVMPKTKGDSLEDLYSAEQALLATQRFIPLFYLPAEWEPASALRDWRLGANGSWRLDEVWLARERQ